MVLNFKNFNGFSEQKRFGCQAFGKDGIAYTACSLNMTLKKIRITSDSVRDRDFFFYLCFLSRTFTINRTARERGGYIFNSSLPLPPASQALRHQPGINWRGLTSYIVSSRTQTENLWFSSISHQPLSYAPLNWDLFYIYKQNILWRFLAKILLHFSSKR